jgi:hypothetical protein
MLKVYHERGDVVVIGIMISKTGKAFREINLSEHNLSWQHSDAVRYSFVE